MIEGIIHYFFFLKLKIEKKMEKVTEKEFMDFFNGKFKNTKRQFTVDANSKSNTRARIQRRSFEGVDKNAAEFLTEILQASAKAHPGCETHCLVI